MKKDMQIISILLIFPWKEISSEEPKINKEKILSQFAPRKVYSLPEIDIKPELSWSGNKVTEKDLKNSNRSGFMLRNNDIGSLDCSERFWRTEI